MHAHSHSGGHSHHHHHGDKSHHRSSPPSCIIEGLEGGVRPSTCRETSHSNSPTRPNKQDSTPSFKAVKPYRASGLKTFMKEMAQLLRRKESASLSVVALLNLIVMVFLLFLCHATNSMSLFAFSYVTVFDSFALLTCFVSVWASRLSPSTFFSFGYGRFEVLAVFSATILAQLSALFSIKESVERLFESSHEVIHSGEMIVGACIALGLHLLVTHYHCNKHGLFNHVIEAASSSWLQEQVADISQSLCHVVPGLSRLLLPRVNPLILIGWCGFFLTLLSDALLDLDNSHSVDTWAAILFGVVFFGTMFPMSAYAGKILLQTIPPHVIGQLDKCLREASTLDGVLEFRHEHFWTISFGQLAGSLHVRIRRDANEQMVLAHVHDRLRSVVSDLTIQAFKDDWASRVGVSSSFSSSTLSRHLQAGMGSSALSTSPGNIISGSGLPSGPTYPGSISSGLLNYPPPPPSNSSSSASKSTTPPSTPWTASGWVGAGGGWNGNATSTPGKDDEIPTTKKLVIDLKPPSAIDHLVGPHGGGPHQPFLPASVLRNNQNVFKTISPIKNN